MLNVAAHRHMAKVRSRRQLICLAYGDRTHSENVDYNLMNWNIRTETLHN